jgi:dienelactone hydrolase
MGSRRVRAVLVSSVILLTAAATAAPAPPPPALAGAWEGKLLVGSLRVVLRLDHPASGWTAALDSPDQGAHDIPAGSVKLTGDKLEATFPSLSGGFVGRISGDALRGTWTQFGKANSLDLARRAGTPGAGGPAGTWDGALESKLTVVFHVDRTATGWTATADSPDQGQRGMTVDSVTVAGETITFAIGAVDATFTGRLQGDRLVGALTQHGKKMPLDLARTDHPTAGTRPPRPQEPAHPLPYDEIALTVPGGSPQVQLACTLTKPRGAGPFGAVVLATGSGAQDRDESLMGHKPFLVLSDALTRAGVEVLRCDDRGVGASTGTFKSATTLDFAGDALAAVAALGQRPEVAHGRIGIVGHSEGSTVAAIAATRSQDVAFIVLLAPPALSGRDIEHLQRAWFERHAGETDKQIAAVRAKWDKAYAVVAAEKDDARAKTRLRVIYDGLPASDRAQIDAGGGFEAAASQLLSPWHRAFLSLDPREYLARVRVPVLALLGERDMQVPPEPTVPELAKALAADPDVTIRKLPGLNHLFQSAQTGAPAEYEQISETMSPKALAVVSGWVAEQSRR